MVSDVNVAQLGAVQSVRYGLSSALSTLPVSVYRRGAKGSRQALPDHPISRLFAARPNELNSPAEFVGELAWHMSYYRNSFCRIQPPSDRLGPQSYGLGGLELIRSAPPGSRSSGAMTAGSTIRSIRRRRWCRARRCRTETYREDEIWHLRGNPLREDGLLGEPIFESSRKVFGRAIAVHDYGDLWFANSGQTGGIIEHPGTFKDKEAQRDFLDTWRRHQHRAKPAPRSPAEIRREISGASKVTNAEAQLLETRIAADTAVFGCGVIRRTAPADSSGRPTTTSSSSPANSSSIAWRRSRSRSSRPPSAICCSITTTTALFIEFNFAGLLRGDLLNRYKAYLIGRQGEWLSANDILAVRKHVAARSGRRRLQDPMTKDFGADSGDDATGGAGKGTDNNEEGDDDGE